MNRITPACKNVLFSLWRKYMYFKNREKLNETGGFYYDDARLAREEGVSTKTVKRSRLYLQQIGYLRFIPGVCRGRATVYQILKKPDKLYPFLKRRQGVIMSKKDDKLSSKGGLNVSPNKGKNNIKNKELSDLQRNEMHNGMQELIEKLKNK
jgi:hypothetical protein